MYRNHSGNLLRQRGASLISWLLLLCILVVIGTLTARVAPLYWTYSTVVSIAQDVQRDREIAYASRTEVWQVLDRRLRESDLSRLGVGIFSVTGRGQEFTITVQYDDRTHLVGNLDVVARFERRIGPE